MIIIEPLPAKELHLKWVCFEQGSNSFKTPEVCCVDIYYFMILYILWESWRVASRSYTLWARREGLPLPIGGQKPLTITERERDCRTFIYRLGTLLALILTDKL